MGTRECKPRTKFIDRPPGTMLARGHQVGKGGEEDHGLHPIPDSNSNSNSNWGGSLGLQVYRPRGMGGGS